MPSSGIDYSTPPFVKDLGGDRLYRCKVAYSAKRINMGGGL